MSNASSFHRAACGSCSFLPPLCLLLTGLAHSLCADELDRWHWRNPLPSSVGFEGLTFTQSRFVGVGNGGWILSSTNAQQWTTTYGGLSMTFMNVIASEPGFLAFGYSDTNGVFLRSPDGSEWTAQVAPEAAWMADAVFARGEFVGVGLVQSGKGGPSIATSPDGRQWTTLDLSSLPDRSLNGIAYGNGRWVAVGDRGSILTSTDGETWNASESGAIQDLKDVAYGDGQFVVVGNRSNTSIALVSPDGVDWTTTLSRANGAPTSPTFLYLDHVAFGANGFVAIGAGSSTLGSPDGQTWTEYPLGQELLRGGVAFGNGQWAVGGLALTPSTAFTTALLTSADGRQWTDHTGGVPSVNQNGIAFGNGVHVAVAAGGRIARSTNGVDWSLAAVLGNGFDLARVVHAGGRFLAMGSQGNNALLLVSEDGRQWTNRAPAASARLLGAASGNGRSVVVSGATVLVSTNGDDWQLSPSTSASNLFDVVFDGRQFVAAGRNGTIQTSRDGVDWMTRPGSTNALLRGIAFGESTYVAVGRGVVVVSTNAVDWVTRHTGDFTLQSVVYGGGWFVAAGVRLGVFPSDILLTSGDGQQWSQRDIGGNLSPSCLAFDGQSFLLGGSGGAILKSDPVIASTPLFLSVRRTSEIELFLTGEAGRSYSIEATADLGVDLSWTPVTTFRANSNSVRVPPLPASNLPFQFYRARLEPQ